MTFVDVKLGEASLPLDIVHCKSLKSQKYEDQRRGYFWVINSPICEQCFAMNIIIHISSHLLMTTKYKDLNSGAKIFFVE